MDLSYTEPLGAGSSPPDAGHERQLEGKVIEALSKVIGIRMALGARRADVLRLVVGR